MGYEVVFHAVPHKEVVVIYEDRTLTVETIPLKHRVPCCGYLFREKAPLPHIRKDMIDYCVSLYMLSILLRKGLDG